MKTLATWGVHYWPLFLIISSGWLALGFGIPEGIALGENPSISHVDNTLSYYARTELHANVAIYGSIHTIAWWATFIIWMTFVIWITAHIWFVQFG
jgi:hypothetical protein